MNNAQAALQQPTGSERRKQTGLRALKKQASGGSSATLLRAQVQRRREGGRWNRAPNAPSPEMAWRGSLPLGEGCSFPSGGTVHLNGLPRAEQGVLAFSPLDLLASLLPVVSPPVTLAEVHEMLALAPGTQQSSLKSRDGASRAILPAELHLESNLPMFKKTLKHALPL